MDLRFELDCSLVSELVRQNNLRETSFEDSSVDGVYTFALGQGVKSFPGGRWFSRGLGRFGDPIGVVVIPTRGGSCTVFADSYSG